MKLTPFLAVIVGFNASYASAAIVAANVASNAAQLRSTISGAALTSPVKAPLIAQYLKILSAANCTSTANGLDCSKASQDQLETAQEDLQQLRGDFTTALRQAATTLALAETFAAAAVQVRSAIAQSGLTTAAQVPLITQYLNILSAAKCTSTAISADCSLASQDQLTTAQDALQQLRYALTSAVKQPAAGQAPSQTPAANAGQPQNTIAQPFVTAAGQVRSAITSEGLTAAAQAPLIAQFQKMATAANCTSTANGLDCSKASQMQLVLGQVDLQLLRDALAAALKQVAAGQALDQAFAAGAIQVRSAIEQSGLAAAAQSPLFSQFIQILSAAKCTSTAKSVDCSQSSQAQLATAQAALQQLRVDLTAALTQAAASLALAQKTFAASAGMVLSALNDKKMYAVQGTFYPQLDKVLSAAKCTRTAAANGVDCSQATQAQLAAAQSGLDTVSLEVGKIAATLQASGGLALSQQTFAAGAGRLLAQINALTMTPAARSNFTAQFAFDLNEASCTNTAKGVDCSKAEQSQLSYAQKLFDTLSGRLPSGQPAPALKTAGPGTSAAAGLPTSVLLLNP